LQLEDIRLAMHLINWQHLPFKDLGNVTEAELQFISEASTTDRNNDEFTAFLEYIQGEPPSDDYLPMLQEGDIASEMDRVELESLPEDTRRQMFLYGERFKNFLVFENLGDFRGVPNTVLNEYIRFFYFKLKKQDGEPYAPASLVCIRAGLQRYFYKIEKLDVNIIDGEDFKSANDMLRVKVREFHQAGGSTKQFHPIEEGDLEALRAYFGGTSAEVGQDRFLFYLLYCFGERGQEHIKYLKDRDCLELNTDSDGKKYYCLGTLPSKNKSADPVKAKKQVDNKQARIYDTKVSDVDVKLIFWVMLQIRWLFS
jgi:hypothetical protein